MSVKYYWTFLYQEWWGQSNPPLPPSTLLPFFVPLLVTTTSTTKHSVQCLECILLYTKISGDPLQWYESIPLYQADSEKWLCHHATQICNVFLQTFSRVLHNFTASVKPGLSPLPRGESPQTSPAHWLQQARIITQNISLQLKDFVVGSHCTVGRCSASAAPLLSWDIEDLHYLEALTVLI